MIYEHKSRVRTQGLPVPIKIISILIVIIFFVYMFFPGFTSTIFTFIVSPFWNIEKNIKDTGENISTDLQNSTINELIKENTELKTILHMTATSSAPRLSLIIKKPPFTVYDSYIIDVSSHKDAKIGDKIYSIRNVLLGEIVEIRSSFAKVKLYSSFGEKFDVLIGKSSIQAIATGQGGGAFQVVLPKDAKINEGDAVTIPDLSISVFGVVKKVTVDNARAFSTILFSQPINIYEQKWVIIKK